MINTHGYLLNHEPVTDLKGDKERDVCLQTLRTPGLYAEIKIANITGVPEAQKAALKMLGAVDETIPTPSLTA